ncbi:MAG: hypothetical protein JO340_14160 [Acidobacteriaceae bacterium]|nr:hypothetical protein [Acidobacteriaceae bacterium]
MVPTQLELGPTTYYFTGTPAGWGHNPFLVQSDAGGGPGGDVMACFSHVATSSEPSTYAWSQSNTNDGMTAIILDYRNVQDLRWLVQFARLQYSELYFFGCWRSHLRCYSIDFIARRPGLRHHCRLHVRDASYS